MGVNVFELKSSYYSNYSTLRMQTKRTRHDTVMYSVTFRFSASDETISETLYSHVQRLKTKLTTYERKWNGKLLVRQNTAINFYIYDILNQEVIKAVSLDFEASNKVFPVNEGYAVANIQDELYFMDAELNSCRRVFVSSNKKTIVHFGLSFSDTVSEDISTCVQLKNKTIAIGTSNGITICNTAWKIINSIQSPKQVDRQVFRIIELNCGRLITLHKSGIGHLVLWQREFTEPKFIGETSCTEIVQLANGNILGYGLATDMTYLDLKTCQLRTILGDKTNVMKLQNGMHVVSYFLTNQVSVFDTDGFLYNLSYQLGFMWNLVHCEVRPGILAWQVGREMTFFDVEKRKEVEKRIICFKENTFESAYTSLTFSVSHFILERE